MTLGGGGGGKDDSKEEPTVNMNAGPPEGSGGSNAEVDPKTAPPETTSPETAPTPETKTPETTAPETAPGGSGATATPGSDTPPAPPEVETSVTVKITSEPDGAEVLLNDKPIGTTPLTTKLTRTSDTKSLTIRKSKYVSVTQDIDLSKDYTTAVSLEKEPVAAVKKTPEVKKQPEPKKRDPDVKKNPVNTSKGNTTTNTSKTSEKTNNATTPAPPRPACQQPSQYDPTDPRPPCKG
jgi:hypothetical protein